MVDPTWPMPGNCTACGAPTVFATAIVNGQVTKALCLSCGSQFSVEQDAGALAVFLESLPVHAHIPGAKIDYREPGPVILVREAGGGDLLMTGIVAHAAKLLNPANPVIFVSDRPWVGSRDWILGIPWVDQVMPTVPEDAPPERVLDFQGRLQFDAGWWQARMERLDVICFRANIPGDIQKQVREVNYCPPADIGVWMQRYREKHGIPAEAQIAVLAGAALGNMVKRTLPKDYTVALLRTLLTGTEAWWIVRTEPWWQERPEALRELLEAQNVDCSRLLLASSEFAEFTRELYLADLCLCPDSTQMHLAACWDTPQICWFPSSPPESRITYYRNITPVYNAEACPKKKWPCTRHGRPFCARPECITGVAPEEILALVQEKLAEKPVIKVLAPPFHQGGDDIGSRAVEQLKSQGYRARFVPTTVNMSWPTGPWDDVICHWRGRETRWNLLAPWADR